jgi:uncharacterized protein DUF4011
MRYERPQPKIDLRTDNFDSAVVQAAYDQGAEQENGHISAVEAGLADARRELIDLTRRNRLLHCTRTGSRPHCTEFVNTDPDAAFVGLVRDGKHYSFASSKIDSEQGVVELPAIANSVLRQLQTRLGPEQLDRKLLKLFREARTYEEEQESTFCSLPLVFFNG